MDELKKKASAFLDSLKAAPAAGQGGSFEEGTDDEDDFGDEDDADDILR